MTAKPVDTSHEWVPVTFINAIVIGDMEGVDPVCEQVDRLWKCFGAAIQVVDVKADSDFFRQSIDDFRHFFGSSSEACSW